MLGHNINIQEYWRRVRKIQAGLPDIVSVIPVDDTSGGAKAGVICECDSETAAKLFYDGSHRVATEEEIGRQHKTQNTIRLENAREGFLRSGMAVVGVNPKR